MLGESESTSVIVMEEDGDNNLVTLVEAIQETTKGKENNKRL
jgi:hypothetical protein